VGTATYEFYRGLPPSSKIRKQKFGGKWGPENSWDCIQRLAQEVQWRAFFVSGVFYFIAEDKLYKSQPIAMLSEDADGIESIDGDYDEGKKTATLTVKCRMGRWAAPPGSVVGIQNMGPWNGRWLVNDVERSAFDDLGTITLKKPLPRLPEPSGSNLVKDTPDKATWHLAPPANDKAGQQFRVGSALVQPIPEGYGNNVAQGIHSTAGLAGQHYSYFKGTWPSSDAVDFGGRAGAPVVAPESGKVVYWSGHDPALGPVEGLGGPLGWSIYLLGDSGSYYFITHLGTRSAGVGANVRGGQQIGTVADYAKYGGIDHAHVGVNPQGKTGHPDIHDLLAALKVKGPAT
jgi:murein DD-endopeptidase MepM/ murein hydrolase activator NlpD